jgi:EAL domain-containing protein (putative c-di-GMP-specific phosphodiesterase class I)
MTVIAEGVETVGQARMVQADGCTGIQGYLVSVPVVAAEVTALLTRDLAGVLTK